MVICQNHSFIKPLKGNQSSKCLAGWMSGTILIWVGINWIESEFTNERLWTLLFLSTTCLK